MKHSLSKEVVVSLLVSQSVIYFTNAFINQPVTTTLNRESTFSFSRHAVTRLDAFRPNLNEPSLIHYRLISTQLNVAEVSDEKREDNKPEKTKELKVQISNSPVSKFRKLKDIMWIREAVEDLTAAEFACSVDSPERRSDSKQKRAVDYEKLLAQLDRRVSDMLCQSIDELDLSEGEPELDKSSGMGRYAYTADQRSALLT